jgi:hypothetical protein
VLSTNISHMMQSHHDLGTAPIDLFDLSISNIHDVFSRGEASEEHVVSGGLYRRVGDKPWREFMHLELRGEGADSDLAAAGNVRHDA